MDRACPAASGITPDGSVVADGPPTTFSDSGRDRVAFLQGTLMRDTTYFLNSAPLGAQGCVPGAPMSLSETLECMTFNHVHHSF